MLSKVQEMNIKNHNQSKIIKKELLSIKMGWLTNYSGYVHHLRQEYVSPRKNKGATLDSFLSQKFEYLAASAPVTRPAIPVSRVGDADVLREQNISLNREIDDTNDRLTSAEKKCRLLTRERERKADRKPKIEKRQITKKFLSTCGRQLGRFLHILIFWMHWQYSSFFTRLVAQNEMLFHWVVFFFQPVILN